MTASTSPAPLPGMDSRRAPAAKLDRYYMYGPILRVEAIGSPVTQGSIRSLGKGRPSVHSNAATLKPWRDTIVTAAREQMASEIWVTQWPVSGPVAVDITFTVKKSKGAPKTRRTWPDRRPDVDKLKRAVLDALKAAGVYGDDGQVVEGTARKAYPREHPQALDVPGVLIYVYEIGEPPPKFGGVS